MIVHGRFLGVVGFLLLALVCSLIAVLIVTDLTEVSEPYPLTPNELQRVTNRVPGIAGPAAHYGQTMVITGALCTRTDKPVKVLTTLSWQAVGQTGTFVTVAEDIPQQRKPGCEQFRAGNAFHNPMPAAVVAATQTLHARGVSHVRWVVNGYERPIIDGKPGLPNIFTSEPFEVVP